MSLRKTDGGENGIHCFYDDKIHWVFSFLCSRKYVFCKSYPYNCYSHMRKTTLPCPMFGISSSPRKHPTASVCMQRGMRGDKDKNILEGIFLYPNSFKDENKACNLV